MDQLHQNPLKVGVGMYDTYVIKKYLCPKMICVRDWVYALPRSRWSGISLIINKGMLTKNSYTLCRLLLQDGRIASKSVHGGYRHVWLWCYKEILFKNSKFIRVEICRDRSVLHCALRPENTQNESQNDQKFIGTSWFYILFVFLWLQMTLMWTSLLGTLLLVAFHFRLQFSGHEFHCLDAKKR